MVEFKALHHFFHLGGVDFCLVLRVAHANNTGGILAKKALDIDNIPTRKTGDHKPAIFVVDPLVGHLQPVGEFGQVSWLVNQDQN